MALLYSLFFINKILGLALYLKKKKKEKGEKGEQDGCCMCHHDFHYGNGLLVNI